MFHIVSATCNTNMLFLDISAQVTKVDSPEVMTEESEEDSEVHEQVAELASEEGMGAGYHGGSNKEVEEKTH